VQMAGAPIEEADGNLACQAQHLFIAAKGSECSGAGVEDSRTGNDGKG